MILLPKFRLLKPISRVLSSDICNYRLLSTYKLTHNDWLSSSDVINILKPLHSPATILSAWEQYSCRRDFRPTEPVLTLLIEKLASAGRFEAMDTIMSQIGIAIRCKLSESFFDFVIRAYGGQGRRIRRAIEVLLDMPKYGCWPSVRTFNYVLNLLVAFRLYEEAAELYVKAPLLGVQIDTSCLNILLKAACEVSDFDTAYKVFDEFPHQRCARNARSYAILMHGLVERGKVDDAVALLTRMEEESVDADTIVCNVLISGLRKNGRVNEGVKLFEKMWTKGCQPNEGTFLEILYGMIDDGMFKNARDFMSLMLREGHKPCFVAYKRLISGFCMEKFDRDAILVLEEMVDQGFVPRMGTWKEMVRLFVKKDNSSVHSLLLLLQWTKEIRAEL